MNPKELYKGVSPEQVGEISDGYHTFNELYFHRTILFAVICNEHPRRAWKSKLHSDGSMYEGMFIAGIETPTGPATYHCEMEYWDSFKVKDLDEAPEWDGHSPDDAIKRIFSLCNDAPWKYGQMIVSKQETEVETALSGTKVKVPAGNRVVIGFDDLAHHLRDGCIQPISDKMLVRGYSHTGVVAAIWSRLNAELPIAEMLEAVDAEPKEMTDAIKDALEEIGLYE